MSKRYCQTTTTKTAIHFKTPVNFFLFLLSHPHSQTHFFPLSTSLISILAWVRIHTHPHTKTTELQNVSFCLSCLFSSIFCTIFSFIVFVRTSTQQQITQTDGKKRPNHVENLIKGDHKTHRHTHTDRDTDTAFFPLPATDRQTDKDPNLQHPSAATDQNLTFSFSSLFFFLLF